MKGLIFFLVIVCYCCISKAQDLSGYAYVDSRALSIPKADTYSANSIAAFVQSNFKTDREKLRGIYTWVINNIRYDTDSMYPINWSLEHAEKISATLRRKRGVCDNYASVFTEVAVKCGFPSFVISGNTKLDGALNRSGHSWSAVYLEQEWYLCDPTWDNGLRGGTRYFLVPPGEFIESHIPFDPLWQLLEYPISEQAFTNRSSAKKNREYFNYKDSVMAFLQLDSLQQLESAARRIRQAGIANEKQRNWLAYNQMKIAGIYGEKDMNLYNAAVEDLNKANGIFNQFVQYRNNLFIPRRPDAEIKTMLSPIDPLVTSARKKLDQIGKEVENFQYDTGGIMERLTTLSGRVKDQQDFLNRYLAADTLQRQRLFYK